MSINLMFWWDDSDSINNVNVDGYNLYLKQGEGEFEKHNTDPITTVPSEGNPYIIALCKDHRIGDMKDITQNITNFNVEILEES